MPLTSKQYLDGVRKLPPRQRLLHWIGERWIIYERRRLGQPRPWTEDPILQGWRFCNVRRIDDTVSRWLLDNWYRPNLGHFNMLLAVTLARQVNWVPSLQAVGFPYKWYPQRVQEVLEERQRAGEKVYSSAYMITSRYGTSTKRSRPPETKPYQTVWRVCQALYETIKDGKVSVNPDSMEDTWRRLLAARLPGFSSFIAGQVVADLRWALPGEWSDRMDWAPPGPGSTRGLNRLLGRPIGQRILDEEFRQRLEEVSWIIAPHRGGLLPDDMEMMDIQGCMCEYDKYERVLWCEGTPRQRYPGHAETS